MLHSVEDSLQGWGKGVKVGGGRSEKNKKSDKNQKQHTTKQMTQTTNKREKVVQQR